MWKSREKSLLPAEGPEALPSMNSGPASFQVSSPYSLPSPQIPKQIPGSGLLSFGFL